VCTLKCGAILWISDSVLRAAMVRSSFHAHEHNMAVAAAALGARAIRQTQRQ
jgi:hypothetical protein